MTMAAQKPNKLPVIGVWQWDQPHLTTAGNADYEQLIDSVGTHTPFDMLVIFLRFPDYGVTSDAVIQKMKALSRYALDRGVGLVPDLDIRNARHAFIKAHPDALQEMVRMKPSDAGTRRLTLTPILMRDHYSSGNIQPYYSHASVLHKVLAYKTEQDSIVPSTIKDITAQCTVEKSTADTLTITLPQLPADTKTMVICGFKHDYPDVFSPYLLPFQRDILKAYKGLKVVGACKDEWGFPPYFPRYFRSGYVDYWYSDSFEAAYLQKTGRSLLADLFLMGAPQKGNEALRQNVINDYNDLVRHRNVEIETDFYNATKEIFGNDAFVATHSTWWPYPDRIEMRKNGLDWWEAKRDIAQCDEVVPFAVRTSLAKKWGSPVWYNQYYKNDLHMQVWSSALAGGRIDYLDFTQLTGDGLIEAEKKIHLLNFVATAPLDCRVAVVFGYHSATNWAKPHYDDTGMQIADALWRAGYAADLIPSYEIENGSLKIDGKGKVEYGRQKYDAVVYYHPEHETETVRNFFNQTTDSKVFIRTELANDKTKDKAKINDEPVKTAHGLLFTDNNMLIQHVMGFLNDHAYKTITPCNGILDNTWFHLRDFTHESAMPGLNGTSRMLDGGILRIAAVDSIAGDPIGNFNAYGESIKADAEGVVYVRFDNNHNLIAMAAGGVKSFNAGGLSFELPRRMNVALRKNSNGQWEGEVQEPAIPSELKAITPKWTIAR